MSVLFQVVLLFVIALALGMAVYAWQSRPALGATTTTFLMLEVALYASGISLTYLDIPEVRILFWLKVSFAGMVFVPITGAVLNLRYARVSALTTPIAVMLLHLEPIVTLLMAWMYPGNNLYWEDVQIIGVSHVTFVPGRLFAVHFIYSLVVVLLSLYFLARRASRSGELLKNQSIILIVATLVPFGARILYVTVFNRLQWADPTPFFLALTAMLYLWGFFKYKMLDIIPVAYETIVKGMNDGLIIIDTSNRIVQINDAAEQILRIDGDSVIGVQVDEILVPYPEVKKQIRAPLPVPTEAWIHRDDGLSSYEFQVSALLDRSGKRSGRMLTIRDITLIRERENTQKRRAEELETLHNILLDITISKDMGVLLQTIVERAVALLKGAGGSLYLSDPRKNELRCAATINSFHEHVGAAYSYDTGPGLIAASAKPLITNQRMVKGDQTGPAAVIGVPLIWQERVTGVIAVMDDQPGRVFSEEDLRLLEMLSHQATIVVENARLLQEERQQRAQAETLREVTASLSSSLELERVLDLILEQLARVVPYDSTSLMLIKDGTIDIVAQRGFRVSRNEFPNLGLNQLQHCRQVIEEQIPIIIPDTSKDPRWIKWLESEYISCWLGIPLIYQGKAIGLLNVDKEHPNFYSEADAQLATAFANQAVLAIENARLFENAGRRAREAETLRKATAVVATTLKQDEAIQLILDQLANVIDYASASIQLLEGDELVIVGGRGWTNEEVVVGFRFPIPGDNPNTKVILERQPYVLGDAPAAYPTFRTSFHSHIKSWLGVPLIVHDRIIGMLALDGSIENSFTEDDVNLVSSFADQVAIAIENARLFSESEQRATTLSRLYASAQDLTESLDQDIILEKLLKNICQALEVTSTYILEVDKDAGTLTVLAEYFSDQACEQERVSDLNEVYHLSDYPVVMEAYQSGQPVYYFQDSPCRSEIEINELKEYGVQSAMMVPVTLRGELIGEIEIWESRYPRHFTQAEQQLATALSQHATAVLENARMYEREKLRVDELNSLRATMTDISSELELPKLLQAILQRSVAFLKATGGELGLMNEQKGQLEIVVCHNLDDEAVGVMVDLGVGAMGIVAQTHQPLVVPHYQTWEHRPERVLDKTWSSVIAVPMIFHNRLLGVIGIVAAAAGREFTTQERDLLELFAQQAAIAVANATLFQEQRTAAEKRAILHHASQEVVATSLDPEGIYNALHKAASQLMPSEAFAITVVDESRSMVDAVYLYDHKGRSKPISFPKGRGLMGNVIQTGESIYLPDILDPAGSPVESIRVGDKEDVRSIIAVPMKFGDKITGTLSAQSYQPRAYSSEDIRLLEMLASYAAIALENARLFQVVQKLAITDPLLGIYNRRQLFDIGQREFTRSLRFGRPLAVILYDIDDFKNVNDSFGHPVGDQVLRDLCTRVEEMIREIDTLGRFGGDEFVIILPETTRSAGEWVAERIRRKIAETPFYTEADNISITICLGVTELTPDVADFESLVARADAAQYDAKQAGKNRVGAR